MGYFPSNYAKDDQSMYTVTSNPAQHTQVNQIVKPVATTAIGQSSLVGISQQNSYPPVGKMLNNGFTQYIGKSETMTGGTVPLNP